MPRKAPLTPLRGPRGAASQARPGRSVGSRSGPFSWPGRRALAHGGLHAAVAVPGPGWPAGIIGGVSGRNRADGVQSAGGDLWRLDGRVALGTGTSAGPGAQFARVLPLAGAHVLATARRADLLNELARECGERIETMPGDITDASHRQALAERLASRGRLDVLVNNAGICDDGPIEEQSLEELRQVIEVNLINVLDMYRLSAPLLLAAPAASVINVASMHGIVAPAARWPPTTPPKAPWSALAGSWPPSGASAACGSTRRPRLLPDRPDRPPGRRRLRPVHPRAHAACAHPRNARTRRPVAVPWPPPPPATQPARS